MRSKVNYELWFKYPSSRTWMPWYECDYPNNTHTLKGIRAMKSNVSGHCNNLDLRFKIVKVTTSFKEVK